MSNYSLVVQWHGAVQRMPGPLALATSELSIGSCCGLTVVLPQAVFVSVRSPPVVRQVLFVQLVSTRTNNDGRRWYRWQAWYCIKKQRR